MRARELRRLPWVLRYETGARWASQARRLAVLATHRHGSVRFDGPVRLGPGFALDIPAGGTFRVGPLADFRRGFVCEISGDGVVEVGAGCVFTADALVQCSTRITFGAGSILGQSAMVADGAHRFRDWTRPFLEQGYDFRPVTIGAGAVVMSKCTITADVGERAVVAAHSVVTRPIPPYCLAAGAPARVVEYFGPPELRPAELPG